MPNEPKKQRPSKRINQYPKYAAIPFQMVAIVGLGTYAGYQIDASTGNQDSLYTILFSFASVCIAMYLVIKQVTRDSKNKDSD